MPDVVPSEAANERAVPASAGTAQATPPDPAPPETMAPKPDANDANAIAVHHLLLFCALVYVVEGLGQIGGLISQPLNYFPKEVHGFTPLQVTAFVTLFNLPWIIKPVY